MSDAEALARSRSAVLNVLLVVGLGIAASGAALSRRDPGAAPIPPMRARGPAQVALLGLVGVSVAARRLISSRTALRDPSRRASRLFWGPLAATIAGALAIPLGFAYGWASEPALSAVAPFWVAALALGALAIPRASMLDGLDDDTPDEPAR